MLSKVMEDVELPVPVEEIDIDANQDAAIKFGIRGVPTLVLVDDTESEVKRISGMLMEKQLLDFINK
jgi:thioredoxin 1